MRKNGQNLQKAGCLDDLIEGSWSGKDGKSRMAKPIMIQGTMSGVGKSLLAAGLCRIFSQDGYRTAPFKSQNMALNSFVTSEGLEMGRAQVMQAEAAGIEPSVRMNPILLKPVNDRGSQVIVNGEVRSTMEAREYFRCKKSLIPEIMEAYNSLDRDYQVIVLEGAGSPAEINLKQDDIVNMGMARLARSPVLLAGDIDRGGVFAQLIGTVLLLEPEEQAMVKGLIVNKFRGDKTILDPGIRMLAEKCGIPVIGVVPYMDLRLEDEDSLSDRLDKGRQKDLIDIAVIRFPRISNYTDLNPLEQYEGVSVRYVTSPAELGSPDLILLPGTKSTIGDLLWMRQNGLETLIRKAAAAGCLVMGICGGYQMLGRWIRDPEGTEAEKGARIRGLELLPVTTVFEKEKTRRQVQGWFNGLSGSFAGLSGAGICGYEIHMGRTVPEDGDAPALSLRRMAECEKQPGTEYPDGCCRDNVLGTYVHGVFDQKSSSEALIRLLYQRKGLEYGGAAAMDYRAYKETQYDLLAETLRRHLDMERVYRILEQGL